jgi:hypothetical protein
MNPILSFLNKNIKLNNNYSSILENRIVLYFLCFMAIIDVMYFSMTNDIRSLITLLIVGLLTTFFNKNMIVVLVLALTVTHVLKYGTNVSEGMTNGGGKNNREGMKDTIDAALKQVSEDNESALEEEPSPKEKKDKVDAEALKETLKTDFKEFQTIQKDIISGLQKIDPLLTRVEEFVDKYEKYKIIGEKNKTS